MLNAISRWWSRVRARLRDWAHHVRDEVAGWRDRRPYALTAGRRRQRAWDASWGHGASRRSRPVVRVFREGGDLILEAEDHREWEGERDGTGYLVRAYKYERRRAPMAMARTRSAANAFFGDSPGTFGLPSSWDAPRRIRLLLG